MRGGIKEFQINFVQLQNGSHDFEFEITKDLFDHYEDSLIEKGKGEAFLTLEKSERMMQLHFSGTIAVELICDISLEPFDYVVSLDRDIIVKFGEEAAELSDDVIVIPNEAHQINVADFIYEFISLGIPMKKGHPKLEGVGRSELADSDKTEEPDETGEPEIDPRWEALKKLKK